MGKGKAFLLGGLLLLTMTACGGGEGQVESGNNRLVVENHHGDAILTAQINAFKNAYPHVELVVNDYAGLPTADYDAMQSAMLMGGSTSDVISFRSETIYRCGISPYILDLNDFIDNDPDFNPDDYYMNQFRTLEFDGKLAAISSRVQIWFIGINEAFMEKTEPHFDGFYGLTYSEALAMYKSIDEDGREGYYFSPNFNVYKMLFSSSDYFDPANGIVNFNSPEFINMVYDYENYGDPRMKWNDFIGIILPNSFAQDQYIFFDMLSLNPKLFLPNEEPFLSMKTAAEQSFTFKPLMLNEEEAAVTMGSAFGINANAQNKELAWEFIKFTLSDQYDITGMGPQAYANKAMLDRTLSEWLEWFFRTNYDRMPTEEEALVMEATKEKLKEYAAMPQRFAMIHEIPGYMRILDDFDKGLITPEQMAEEFQNKGELRMQE